jgi:hypothetical protein
MLRMVEVDAAKCACHREGRDKLAARICASSEMGIVVMALVLCIFAVTSMRGWGNVQCIDH